MMKRAMKMDYRAMMKTANMLHKKTDKSRIWLLFDMVKCAAKYNAGYIDYKIAEMYRLNDAQRATQITRGISNNIVARMNDKKFWHFFDNKTEFNELFAAQVRRGWLNLTEASEEEFAKFLEGRGWIVMRVWSRDWWLSPGRVIRSIVNTAEKNRTSGKAPKAVSKNVGENA